MANQLLPFFQSFIDITNELSLNHSISGGNSEGKVKVSNIIQKSGISVDEKGTIAYAATGKFFNGFFVTLHLKFRLLPEIELVNKFGGDPKEFIADHPFVFYIEDDTTGAKLFAGRVTDPQY